MTRVDYTNIESCKELYQIRKSESERVVKESEILKREMDKWRVLYNKARRNERDVIKRYTDYLDALKKLGIYDVVINSDDNKIKCLNSYQNSKSRLYGAVKGVNDLGTTHPNLKELWHETKNGDLTIEDVTEHTNLTVWWHCPKCGGEWQQRISRMKSYTYGCPYCAGKKVLQGFNDLESQFPLIAKEWHKVKNGDLKPNEIAMCSGVKVWWYCPKCGCEWQETIINRTKCGRTCPDCSRINTHKREGSYPEIAVLMNLFKIDKNIIHRYRFSMRNQKGKLVSKEIDIFLPKLKIGIEYDGMCWHKNRTDKDDEKELEITKRGIRLLRIREDENIQLPTWTEDTIITYKPSPTYDGLKIVIRMLAKKIYGTDVVVGEIYKPNIIEEWKKEFVLTDVKLRNYNIMKNCL